jgi:hypothetical protein
MCSVLSDSREEIVQAPAKDEKYRLTRIVCWSVCIVLALLDAWAGRQYTDPDGISYLDMSDALLKHNWHLLINPHWSPLYPFLIGVATWLARPSAYWELPIVHLVNLFIFLLALASFEFLMRQVISVLGQINEGQDADFVARSAWSWQLLGYSLFAWSTFVLSNGLRKVAPDLCVAMFVYLDAGLLLKLRAGANRSGTCLLLGLTLGLGYLAKAILFPMALVFMAVAFLVVGNWRKALHPFAITLLVFGAIAAPLFISISRMVGRPSFSESGNLNIAWQINGLPMLPFYSSDPPPYLKHPMSLLYRHPDVFGFGEPLASTYPPWRDPQYWNAGVSTAFKPRAQLREIGRNLTELFANLYMAPLWGLMAGGLVLFFMSPSVPRRFQHFVKSWPLLIPGVAGLSAYTLVLVQPRYIAPFLVLVFLGLFSGILLQKSDNPTKRNTIVTLVIAASVMVYTSMFIVLHLAMPLPILQGHGGRFYQAAESLDRKGVRPGESVAIIGSGWDGMIWARLARVRIVAQIPPEDANDFWGASNPRAKAEVYETFATAGAEAVVTEETPPSVGFADWQKVGDTQYYVHILALHGSK